VMLEWIWIARFKSTYKAPEGWRTTRRFARFQTLAEYMSLLLALWQHGTGKSREPARLRQTTARQAGRNACPTSAPVSHHIFGLRGDFQFVAAGGAPQFHGSAEGGPGLLREKLRFFGSIWTL
jgi:hypothetical protein